MHVVRTQKLCGFIELSCDALCHVIRRPQVEDLVAAGPAAIFNGSVSVMLLVMFETLLSGKLADKLTNTEFDVRAAAPVLVPVHACVVAVCRGVVRLLGVRHCRCRVLGGGWHCTAAGYPHIMSY